MTKASSRPVCPETHPIHRTPCFKPQGHRGEHRALDVQGIKSRWSGTTHVHRLYTEQEDAMRDDSDTYPVAKSERGCAAQQPDPHGLLCERPEGHDGPHAALIAQDDYETVTWLNMNETALSCGALLPYRGEDFYCSLAIGHAGQHTSKGGAVKWFNKEEDDGIRCQSVLENSAGGGSRCRHDKGHAGQHESTDGALTWFAAVPTDPEVADTRVEEDEIQKMLRTLQTLAVPGFDHPHLVAPPEKPEPFTRITFSIESEFGDLVRIERTVHLDSQEEGFGTAVQYAARNVLQMAKEAY